MEILTAYVRDNAHLIEPTDIVVAPAEKPPGQLKDVFFRGASLKRARSFGAHLKEQLHERPPGGDHS
jgi:hypothetical protein